MNKELILRIKKLKLLAFDVDGVLTDGSVYYDSNGNEIKKFNTKDGYGIEMATKSGLTVALISGRKSKCVSIRAKELGIKYVYQGVINKKEVINKLIKKLFLKKEEVSFMGDDIPDLQLKENVAIFVSCNDSIEEVKRNADFITSKCGGCGAVREWIDIVLSLQGIR